MRRLVTLSFTVAVAFAAALLSGCDASSPAPPRPNIVIVNIDQLRKDAADQLMTEVGALAERGVVFENMRSVSPWTYPSVVSLLSGLLPQQHGADGHMFENRLATFDASLPTLPQQLGEAGYRTHGFVTNPFLQTWNPLHENFDHYDASFVGSQGPLRGNDSVWKPERMFGDRVNAAVVGHFDALPPESPEFSYIHYIDVHGPWEGAPFEGSYAAAIRFVDDRVAELYHYFRVRYDDKMLFFVTSDHGLALEDDVARGFGFPWRKTKGSLHDFNLLIPAMLLPSDYVTQPKHVTAACSNIDVVPTLLDWLKIEPAVSLQGRSLLEVVQGAPSSALPIRPLYSKMSAFGRLQDSIVLGSRKFIRFFHPQTGQVVRQRSFDLEADPGEVRNLGDDFSDLADEFRVASGTAGVIYPAHFTLPDEEVLERMRQLGYLQDAD